MALTSEGHLNFEEDREGQTYGVRLDRNFLNGARHSVYYTRVNNCSTLMVSRIRSTIAAILSETTAEKYKYKITYRIVNRNISLIDSQKIGISETLLSRIVQMPLNK